MSLREPSPTAGGSPATRRGSAPRRRAAPGLVLDTSGAPVTRARVRRTRMWMLLLLLTPICLGIVSLLALGTNGPPEPVVHPRSTPPGYQAVTDAYFGYAIPSGYKQDPAWTDQNADTFYGLPAAYVAETDVILHRAPTAAAAPPASFESFGESRPLAYRRGPARRVDVPGTAVAYEEQISRPGGFRATAVDAWERDTSTQIWLLVHASPAVTATVVHSLRG